MALKPMKTINFGGEDTYFLKPEWDNIDNTPFGETTTISDTVTWDGNHTVYNVMGIFHHVSNCVPKLEDLQQGGSYISQGETVPFDSSMITDVGNGLINVNSDVFIVTVANTEMDGLVFEKAGIYFADAGEGETQVRSFTINNYTFETTEIKTLDTKFLPKSHQFGEKTQSLSCGSDCFEYAGPEDDMTMLMVTKLIPVVIGNKCTVTVNGTPYECNVLDYGVLTGLYAGLAALVTNAEKVEEVDSATIQMVLMLTEEAAEEFGMNGMLMLLGEYDENVSVSMEQVATTIKTIDKKYIPVTSSIFSAPSDTLLFAGDLSLRKVWSLNDGGLDIATLIKLSDVAPTLEDLQKGGAVLSLLDDGTWSETEFDASAVSVQEAGWIKLAVDVGFMIVEKPTSLIFNGGLSIPVNEGIYTMTLGGGGQTLFLSSQGIRLNGYTGFTANEIANPRQRPVLSIDGVKPNREGNVEIVHPEIPVVKIINFTTTDDVTTTEEDLDDIQRLLAEDNAIVKAKRKKPSTAGSFEFIFYEVVYFDRKPVTKKIQFERRNGNSIETIIWSKDGVTIA